MMMVLQTIVLHIKLLWQHLVFWTIPTSEEHYYASIGHIYFDLGKWEKAITAFKTSEKSHQYHNLGFSRYNTCFLAYCYINVGDFQHAIDYFETYLTLSREDSQALSYLGWCYTVLDDSEAALGVYQRALQLEPNCASLHLACAKIFAELSRKEEALTHLHLAEAQIEDERDMTILKSVRQALDGKIHNAINSLKDALSRSDSLSYASRLVQVEDLPMMLFQYQKEAGEREEALLTLEMAFEAMPYDSWIMNSLAMEYAEQQIDLEKALQLITEALQDEPNNPLFLDTKGWVLFQMGRGEDAKAAIQHSLHLHPEYKEAQAHYQTIIASKEGRSRKATV